MPTDTPSSALPAGLSPTAFSSLFEAVSGLRNGRAIVALLGCLVVGVVVAMLLLSMFGGPGILVMLLAMLVWIVAIGTGVNAAGILQMDEARGAARRSTVDALVLGLMGLPKLVVLGLACLAVEVAVFIAIALLMAVCKIPVLGPMLFVVAFPLSVAVAGITVVGLFVLAALSLPAIWQGETVMRAATQTLAIVRSRFVETLLLLVFVGLLCFVVGLVVFAVFGAGLVPTLALSASILSFGGTMPMGAMAGLSPSFDGAGARYAISGAIGGSVLWAVAVAVVGQVYLRGLSLVYLRVTEGLDLGAAEAALRAGIDDAKRRASELGDRAKSAAARDVVPASSAAPAVAVPTAVTAVTAVTASAAADASHVTAPSLYNPPPAWSAPPTPSFDALQSASFGAPLPPLPAAPSPSHASYESAADIDLPFDDSPAPATSPAPAAPPAYASPPAWLPPPAVAPPVPGPAATVATAPSTCPQCLSPVTADDLFCGVCGYRLK